MFILLALLASPVAFVVVGTSHYVNWTYLGHFDLVSLKLFQVASFIANISAGTSVIANNYNWLVPAVAEGPLYNIEVRSTDHPPVQGKSYIFVS